MFENLRLVKDPAAEPPLDKPLYGATALQSMDRFLQNYVVFTGRSSRSEFWWVALVLTVVHVVLNAIPVLGTVLSVLFSLATIVPSVALIVRRLHDAGFSGFLALIGLVPFLGQIALLVFMVLEPKPEGAQYDVGPAGAGQPAPPAGGSPQPAPPAASSNPAPHPAPAPAPEPTAAPQPAPAPDPEPAAAPQPATEPAPAPEAPGATDAARDDDHQSSESRRPDEQR